jgi:putative transposase
VGEGTFPNYHRTLKNVVKLNNKFAPEELEAALKKFVNRYINKRYHKLLNNITPAAIYLEERK